MEPARGVEVQIEELVLHGFDARHRLAIAEALEGELAALIRGGEPIAGWGDGAPRVDAGSFEVAEGAAPASVGSEHRSRHRSRARPSGGRGAMSESAGLLLAPPQPAPAERDSELETTRPWEVEIEQERPEGIQTRLEVGLPDDPFEREADRAADAVVGPGASAPQLSRDSGAAVRRQATSEAALEDEEDEDEEARGDVQAKPLAGDGAAGAGRRFRGQIASAASESRPLRAASASSTSSASVATSATSAFTPGRERPRPRPRSERRRSRAGGRSTSASTTTAPTPIPAAG